MRRLIRRHNRHRLYQAHFDYNHRVSKWRTTNLAVEKKKQKREKEKVEKKTTRNANNQHEKNATQKFNHHISTHANRVPHEVNYTDRRF
mgnify:CR=1 FL=1